MTNEIAYIKGSYPLWATSDGRIWYQDRNGAKRRKAVYDAHGDGICMRVRCLIDGVNRSISVARVICDAFYGPHQEGMEACHNDGNPRNNRADNLRWDTKAENMKDQKFHRRNPGKVRVTIEGPVGMKLDLKVNGFTQGLLFQENE